MDRSRHLAIDAVRFTDSWGRCLDAPDRFTTPCPLVRRRLGCRRLGRPRKRYGSHCRNSVELDRQLEGGHPRCEARQRQVRRRLGALHLRAATEVANAQAVGRLVNITVPAGAFKLKLGTLTLNHNAVVVTGAGATTTVITAQGASQVVNVATSANVTLNGLELTGGWPPPASTATTAPTAGASSTPAR